MPSFKGSDILFFRAYFYDIKCHPVTLQHIRMNL